MSVSRNTLVFWKRKADGHLGNFGLRSTEEANKFKKWNSDPQCKFMIRNATLTSEELKQVADEKSEVKKGISLEKFNPFSPTYLANKPEIEFPATTKPFSFK